MAIAIDQNNIDKIPSTKEFLMNKIAVIDYGMSNLHSVVKAFQKVVDKNYSVYVANLKRS